MRNRFYQKRIPTLLALILVIGGVFFTSYLVKNATNTSSNAAPDPTPQNVTIANVTNDSFTVVFNTLEQTVGAINVSDQSGNTTLQLDDRDPTNNSKMYYTHMFTVKNLDPNTSYSFNLVSNGQTYDKNGTSYTVQTAKTIPSKNAIPILIQGEILMPDGETGNGILVVVKIGSAQTLATITEPNGTYRIERSYVLDSTFTHPISIESDTVTQLHFYYQGSSSLVSVLSGRLNAIPTITLSENYNFTTQVPSGASPSATTSFSIPQDRNSTASISITSPLDNAKLIDDQPNFSGVALPGNQVGITLNKASINTSVTADAYGNWSYRPSSPLSPGNDTLTITSADVNGISRSDSISFTIFSSGSQVAESATPSATPTFTPTPTATPTVLPTSTPTPVTTQIPTPTPTPTLNPTVTPILTQTPSPTEVVISVTSTPTARPTLAPTGSNSIFTLTFAALAFIFTGATILFLL